MPLLEPGQELVEVGEEGQEAGVVGAAAIFFDVGVVGAEGDRQLQVVVTGPGDRSRSVGMVAVGEAVPALFGDVEFAAQAPVGAAEEVAAGVFGGDGDGLLLEFAAIFGALEFPGAFPFGTFAEAAGFVAEDGQEGDALALDEFGDQGGKVEGLALAVEGGDRHKFGVLAGEVAELVQGGDRGFGDLGGGGAAVVHPAVEVEVALEAVEEPGAKGALALAIPGFGVPAALVFGLFDQADVFVAFDGLEALLDELAVVVGPMVGEVGDRGAAMALEPGGLQVSGGDLATHANLEGALAELQGWGWFGIGEVAIAQAVVLVALPVEFFLQGDHLGKGVLPVAFAAVEVLGGAEALQCLGEAVELAS